MSSVLNFEALANAKTETKPYPFFVVEQSIADNQTQNFIQDFPTKDAGGSFILEDTQYGATTDKLLAELNSPQFREIIEQKLDMDLTGRPMVVTIRGFSRARDGKIHTDSKTKLATVLIYMNPDWDAPTGNLRVLNNATDMDDYVAEVPPTVGKLFAFKVTDNCWHGYPSFEGTRRSIQINFVSDQKAVVKHHNRHGFTSRIKSFFSSKSMT